MTSLAHPSHGGVGILGPMARGRVASDLGESIGALARVLGFALPWARLSGEEGCDA
jgi:hypothetical protein